MSFIRHLGQFRELHSLITDSTRTSQISKVCIKYMSESILFSLASYILKECHYAIDLSFYDKNFDLQPVDSPMWDCAPFRLVRCKETYIADKLLKEQVQIGCSKWDILAIDP